MRLTEKYKDINIIKYQEGLISLMYEENKNECINYHFGKIVDKLAEYEDFIEESGFESLKDIKQKMLNKDQRIAELERQIESYSKTENRLLGELDLSADNYIDLEDKIDELKKQLIYNNEKLELYAELFKTNSIDL